MGTTTVVVATFDDPRYLLDNQDEDPLKKEWLLEHKPTKESRFMNSSANGRLPSGMLAVGAGRNGTSASSTSTTGRATKAANGVADLSRSQATDEESARLIDEVTKLCSVLASNTCGPSCLVFRKYITCVSPEHFESAQNLLYEHRGFCLSRRASKQSSNNETAGVIVSRGNVPDNCLVAIYPGTVYPPREKAFLQPRGNPFVYRCSDSTLIDGNDRAVSKLIYRSCTLRDRTSPHLMSDMTWLTPNPANPLAIGQYVDEGNTEDSPANVHYREINLPLDHFPIVLRRFIPNVPYSNVNGSKTLRMVLLVSSREIQEGEELRAAATPIGQMPVAGRIIVR